MKVEFKLTGVEGIVDALAAMPAELKKRGGPARVALRKAAQLIRKQEIANLRAVTSNQTKSGERESTRLLEKNVIVSTGRMPAGVQGQKMLVRVRRKQYLTTPAGQARSGKAITTTIANAQRLEYGTHDQPAEPWIRPAFQAKAQAAIELVVKEIPPAIEKAFAKAAKAKGSR